ncbi:MAG: dihydrolipoamide acetyltransferase family protein [Candidatus Neomarinimicrobiota bacterium]
MIVDVILPKLGESITEGTIIQWHRKVGESIKKDDILLEIGTDKVDSEIPSPAAGIVIEILSKPNDVVPVDQVIAKIDTEAEEGAVPAAAVEAPPDEVVEEKEEVPAEPEKPAAPVTPKRTFYTPLVRSIARKEKISDEELVSIPGTGKGNRVTKKDLLGYIEERREKPEVEVPLVGVPPVPAPLFESAPLVEETVEMDRVRQLIAEHMRKSLDSAAHVHLVSECDMTGIADFMARNGADFRRQEGFKLTCTPFFVLVAVRTIQDFPVFNTSVDGTKVIYKKHINMGLAVATEKGLMVPVIRKCEELNFLGICRRVNDLAERTREGKISADELQDSTFSITNYGIFGNLFGTPIINQPNTAILGVGSVTKRPIVRETEAGDAIIIRSMAYLSLGFDHRLIDGAGGGRFLKAMVGHLETLDTETLI